MSDVLIENPILNSPFEEPIRHFKFTDDGITDQIVQSRRLSGYFVPIPPPKKKGKQLIFDSEWTQDRFEESEFINRVRDRVKVWRQQGWPGVTNTTARLLQHWSSPDRERRLFFCQVEAALVVLEALSEENLDARVTEALPWVLVRYPELDWDWLVSHAKLRNLQNRLGFLVGVARELAEGRPDGNATAARLAQVEKELEQARLAAETTLSRENMPPAERKWLRANRPSQARRWNVLASLTPEQLPYAP